MLFLCTAYKPRQEWVGYLVRKDVGVMFGKTETITMKLDGVHNAATRRTAVQTLRGLDGVHTAAIKGDTAQVAFYPEHTTVSALTSALAQAGFAVI